VSLRRGKLALLPACLIALLASGSAAAMAAPGTAVQTQATLAATPYMGWDTYLALGPAINESIVLTQASRLVSDGLEKAGYRLLWLDVGWWQGERNSKGEITVNSSQWPHGMAWLAATLHKAGFLVGLYTDAGRDGCGGSKQGSYGHYQQDANTFAAWGFDAVKVDFCGGGKMHLDPAKAYAAFHDALEHNSTHRPMLLSICDFREPGQIEGEPPYDESAFTSYSFGPSDGNSWRTDTDIGFPGIVGFSAVLRNLDADAAHPEAAGPGHWNDPDYLAPDQGLTAAQFKTQMSMWAMLAAPMMVSDNLTTITRGSLNALKNEEVVAIDQDPAGIQGTLLRSSGEGQVWVKPLYGGDRAVALLNVGSKPLRISTSAAAIGMPHADGYRLRNLWSHGTSSTSGTISAQVPGESTVMLRVSTAKASDVRSIRQGGIAAG
jgi:alpha-galactosidase